MDNQVDDLDALEAKTEAEALRREIEADRRAALFEQVVNYFNTSVKDSAVA